MENKVYATSAGMDLEIYPYRKARKKISAQDLVNAFEPPYMKIDFANSCRIDIGSKWGKDFKIATQFMNNDLWRLWTGDFGGDKRVSFNKKKNKTLYTIVCETKVKDKNGEEQTQKFILHKARILPLFDQTYAGDTDFNEYEVIFKLYPNQNKDIITVELLA